MRTDVSGFSVSFYDATDGRSLDEFAALADVLSRLPSDLRIRANVAPTWYGLGWIIGWRNPRAHLKVAVLRDRFYIDVPVTGYNFMAYWTWGTADADEAADKIERILRTDDFACMRALRR